MAERPIELSDEFLGAYADGELDTAAAARIEQMLVHDPEARRRLAAIHDLTRLVRAAMVADAGPARPAAAGLERAPARLESSPASAGAARSASATSSRVERARPPPRRSETRYARGRQAERNAAYGARRRLEFRVAASVVAGALAVLGALELGGGIHVASVDWVDSARAFHTAYLRERESRPVDALEDVLDQRPEELTALTSFSTSLPDLAAEGYAPAGGHLIATPDGPIAYVVFEGGELPPIGFAMTQNAAPDTSLDQAAPIVHSSPSGVTFVSWSAGLFEYALGGRVSANELLPLVAAVRGSLPATAVP